MNKKMKITGLVLLTIFLYYGLQYASTAIHHNCQIIKDDCPPPINLVGEAIYRLIVQPLWLDQFEIDPTTYSFKDGEFSFWEGEVDGKTVVIRVHKDGSPVMQWIFEERLPGKIKISPANGEHIQQWLKSHPQYELTE